MFKDLIIPALLAGQVAAGVIPRATVTHTDIVTVHVTAKPATNAASAAYAAIHDAVAAHATTSAIRDAADALAQPGPSSHSQPHATSTTHTTVKPATTSSTKHTTTQPTTSFHIVDKSLPNPSPAKTTESLNSMSWPFVFSGFGTPTTFTLKV